MELFSPEFFSALLAIIIIDLVLAGDNAIVIALAARNLPPNLRKRAIMWGTVGAIAVRSAMTLVVVWLLKIPGLMLIGGALLVWIAYKLVADNDNGEAHNADPASNFWGAMKTIVIADALMGLDNVLAVAGAAHGSFVLVVLGLLISIPIVIWGSQLILHYVERFPVIIYIGSGVLAWTAVKMVTGEPLMKDYVAGYPTLVWALYIGVVGGVLSGAFLANHRKVRARVMAHVVDLVPQDASLAAAAPAGAAAPKILVPVDGSANSLKAVRHVIDKAGALQAAEIHLLNVRTPFSQYVARFLPLRDRMAYHRMAGTKALKAARALLEKAGLAYVAHVEIGGKAETIDRIARELGIDEIVMGTARRNSITRVLEDSVTSKVLDLTRVPVRVVTGNAVSLLELAAIPVVLGMLVGFVYTAIA